MSSLYRLGMPRPVDVETDPDGTPARIDGRPVEAFRGRWVVEEGWWTDEPIRRRYVEAVLDGGRLVVVFEDLTRGTWFTQPA